MPAFGFVGGAYEAPNPFQDCQKLINWYVEIDPDPHAKEHLGLIGCPGTSSFQTLTPATQVRGAWVLPGGTQCLWVSGQDVWLCTATPAANNPDSYTFAWQNVGSLLTYTGPVVIRDNGAGGSAFIVDGTYGYIYSISGHTVTQCVDPAFLGADRVAFSDGWFIFNKPGTQTFYTSNLYSTAFNSTYFALKDSQTDNLVTLIENNRLIWLIGERSTEIWYPSGGANYGFDRQQGILLNWGCAAKHSIAKLGSELVWLSKSERGQNTVVMTQMGMIVPISTHAIDKEITSYSTISDAIGYSYVEEGHSFYVLTFPMQNVTWCYDETTKLWHQRASFAVAQADFGRHIGNCHVNFCNMHLIGGFSDGTVYRMSRSYYTDNGNPLICVRRAPHLWDGDRRQRLFYQRLQVEFAPGVGIQTGQGSDPQAMCRWSDDGGKTWSNEHWTGVGKAGAYKNRAIWRRLGAARDRVFEVRFSDPVNRDVVGATVDVK